MVETMAQHCLLQQLTYMGCFRVARLLDRALSFLALLFHSRRATGQLQRSSGYLELKPDRALIISYGFRRSF